MDERIIATDEQSADDWQYSLRPRRLVEYIGQDKAKKNLSVFVKAPSIRELRRRLETRGTDSPAFIDERVKKARIEMMYQPRFDHILVNDSLPACLAEAEQVVGDFLKR